MQGEDRRGAWCAAFPSDSSALWLWARGCPQPRPRLGACPGTRARTKRKRPRFAGNARSASPSPPAARGRAERARVLQAAATGVLLSFFLDCLGRHVRKPRMTLPPGRFEERNLGRGQAVAGSRDCPAGASWEGSRRSWMLYASAAQRGRRKAAACSRPPSLPLSAARGDAGRGRRRRAGGRERAWALSAGETFGTEPSRGSGAAPRSFPSSIARPSPATGSGNGSESPWAGMAPRGDAPRRTGRSGRGSAACKACPQAPVRQACGCF